MRLRERYHVSITGADFRVAKVALPLKVDWAGTAAVLDRRPEGDDSDYLLTFESRVDPALLELVPDTGMFQSQPDGSRGDPIPAVRIQGGPTTSQVGSPLTASAFLDALAFLSDAQIAVRRPPDADELVPEGEEDIAMLETLGTARVYRPLSGQTTIRTFSAIIDHEAILALVPKAPGLRLYADALRIQHPVGQFRELWRVLESAFGRKNRHLTALLADFPPARQIGCTLDEAEALRTLRGRASHAESRAGLREILAVEQEARQSLPRLKSLVERVVMTKEPWGTPNLAMRDLLPPSGWVTGDGGVVIVQHPDGRPTV